MEKIKLLLADDHSVVRHGVAIVLKESFNNIAIVHADSLDEAIKAVEMHSPHMLLLDINLPGGNTVGMIKKIKQAKEDIRILMFSAYDEEQYALRYIHAGVDGYLNKLSSEDKIVEAVTTILNGGKYISNKVKDKIFDNVLNKTADNPLDLLSNRELEIAGLLARGEGNLEISNRLNIRMSTVSTYKARIFEKLGVSNVVSLVEKYKLYIDS
jgi:DNA-binding NarL/FixJ family response regulator